MKQTMTIQQAFAYWTECQLATVEHNSLRKNFPKGEAKRQQSIANGMVADCKRFRVSREDALDVNACRVIEAMQKKGHK